MYKEAGATFRSPLLLLTLLFGPEADPEFQVLMLRIKVRSSATTAALWVGGMDVPAGQ